MDKDFEYHFKRLQRFEKWYAFFLNRNPKFRVEWGGSMRCITSDGRNVNMADELNRLDRGKR
jgi:hypothetical protein